jgi:beta-lactamase class C
VRQFEDMAQQLVSDQRIPAWRWRSCRTGASSRMRGYGITDTRAAEPIDAHTVSASLACRRPSPAR